MLRRACFSLLRRAVLCVSLAGALCLAEQGAPAGAPRVVPRNLFAELLGRSEAEVQAKIDASWQQLFYGEDKNQRVYYPVGDDMAYIADVGNGDVRSEGMSYGMMIAVQMGKQAEFDRLWKWAKTHMWHATGERQGYFAWQCRFDGTHIDPGSASDGEEWIAMALLFASNRWGDREGLFAYGKEGRALLHAMLSKQAATITPIFDAKTHLVVFAPTLEASRYTDPSYHLPAYYELWALWADEADRPFWVEAAAASRAYLKRSAHPVTGLMPEYSAFDGTPSKAPEKGDFRFDAWRILANVAIDHAWFGKDPWQVEQSNRVLKFLLSKGGVSCPNQMTLDGKALSAESSTGLSAMAAVAGLAADKDLAKPFVKYLWKTKIPKGPWRYYDGLLYQLALLQAGGRFHIIDKQADAVAR